MTKATRKEKWMREFSDFVYLLDASVKGKVDWDTATYLYNTGLTPSDAANKYVNIPKERTAL